MGLMMCLCQRGETREAVRFYRVKMNRLCVLRGGFFILRREKRFKRFDGRRRENALATMRKLNHELSVTLVYHPIDILVRIMYIMLNLVNGAKTYAACLSIPFPCQSILSHHA